MNWSSGYDQLIKWIEERMEHKQQIILAIDGRCGSGKTSLASRLQTLYPARVLHMDDFYLPFEKRKANWEQIPGGNMDFERFMKEALLPAVKGENIAYRPYRCQKGGLLEQTLLEPMPLTIVEGSYALYPTLADYYDFKVFLSCSKEAQCERIEAREGVRYSQFLARWIPMEEAYFKALSIEEKNDLYIDTSR